MTFTGTTDRIFSEIIPNILADRALKDFLSGHYNPPKWTSSAFLEEPMRLLTPNATDAEKKKMVKTARENKKYMAELYNEAYERCKKAYNKVA